MNRTSKLCVCLACMIASRCAADFGCMDTSWHLDQPFDNKALHTVECTCPCRTYRADVRRPLTYGQCPKCGHINISQRPVIITKKDIASLPADRPTTRKGSLQNVFQAMSRCRSNCR